MSRRSRVGEIVGNVFGFGLAVSGLLLGAYWMFRHDPASDIAVRSTFAIPDTIALATLAKIDALQSTPTLDVLETSRIAAVAPPSVHGTHGGSVSVTSSRTKRHAHATPASRVAVSHLAAKASAPQRLAREDAVVANTAAPHDVPAHAYCTAAALARNICLPEAQLTGQ